MTHRATDPIEKYFTLMGDLGRLGVGGTGLNRARQVRDLPMFPSVRELLEGSETQHRTLWSVLEDGLNVEAVVRATARRCCAERGEAP